MPKVSVMILTKERPALLQKALLSVASQNFKDYEVIVVNNSFSDDTGLVLREWENKNLNLKILNHKSPAGITASRQEALEHSRGQYIAILDDDDEWVDTEKLQKQVKYLDEHPEVVLVGGSIEISDDEFYMANKTQNLKSIIIKNRPKSDLEIRRTMLLRNNFFTSTVMFRKQAALRVGGFISDGLDVAEDYDLWLRLGILGEMYNFAEVFTKYRKPDYNKGKLQQFFKKQLALVNREKSNYPRFFQASWMLRFRIWLTIL